MTPPRDLADAQNRLDQAQAELHSARMMHHIADQHRADAQARLDRIRDYAQLCRKDAEEIRRFGNPYAAIPYDNTAAALERIIGGEQ